LQKRKEIRLEAFQGNGGLITDKQTKKLRRTLCAWKRGTMKYCGGRSDG
jgi:hypothetical protein